MTTPFISNKKFTVLYNPENEFESAMSHLIKSDARIVNGENKEALIGYLDGITPELVMYISNPFLEDPDFMLKLFRKCGYKKIYIFCKNVEEGKIAGKIGAYCYERLRSEDQIVFPIDPYSCFNLLDFDGLTGSFIAADLVASFFYTAMKKEEKVQPAIDTRKDRWNSFSDACMKFDIGISLLLRYICEAKDGLTVYENMKQMGEVFIDVQNRKVLFDKNCSKTKTNHGRAVPFDKEDSENIKKGKVPTLITENLIWRETDVYYPFHSKKLAELIASRDKSLEVAFYGANGQIARYEVDDKGKATIKN